MRLLLRSIVTVCVAAAMLFGVRGALAQGGPPLITDDPGTPGDGNWEINMAFTAEKRRTETLYETPLLDFNYGVGDRIQLKYEIPWVVLDQGGEHRKNGLGNSLLGVKWRFLDQASRGLDVSVYPQLAFNSTDSASRRGLVEHGVEFVLPVQFRRSFGRVSLNPEFGYVFREYEKDEWIYGLAIGYEASKRLELLAEFAGVTDRDFRDDELVFNLGSRVELSERFRLLLSGGRSFRPSRTGEPELLIYAGMQLMF